MNQPTKEQWLWEQCGLKKTDVRASPKSFYWDYPDGTYGETPDIDSLEFLGFLFKYAVPKLDRRKHPLRIWTQRNTDDWSVSVDPLEQEYITMHDPALALFWAIYKALGGKE